MFPTPVTARYLRFTAVDTFCHSYAPNTDCGKTFMVSGLTVGRLAPVPLRTVTVTTGAPNTQSITTNGVPHPSPPLLRIGKRARRGGARHILVPLRCAAAGGCRVRLAVRRGHRVLARRSVRLARHRTRLIRITLPRHAQALRRVTVMALVTTHTTPRQRLVRTVRVRR
jgi:hypothetical protein